MPSLRVFLVSLCFALYVQCAPNKRSYRIFHGERITKWADNPYKHVVVLFGPSTCTGSLYNADTVVSAAHCIYAKAGKPIVVGFEATEASTKMPKKIDVKDWITRNDYDFKKDPYNGNDVAIVKLKTKVPTTGFDVSFVKLMLDKAPTVGIPIYIVGYGKDDKDGGKHNILKKGRMKLSACPEGDISGNPLCMKDDKTFNNQHIDIGDSGGPVMVEDKRSYEAFAVVSAAAEYDDDSVVYVIATTHHNADFIRKNA